MSNFAFVFPGQGSQYVGMGQALAAASPAAADVFRAADEALGEPISRLSFEGPADELDLTVNAQPAILATSIAYLRAADEMAVGLPTPDFYAGHSMGQYSAMVAAGVITLEDGVRLVRERGRQMQAAADASGGGAMAAIIGLDDSRLAELLEAGESVGVFTIANRNSPGQIVVSGTRAAVDAAATAARELGAKRAIVLPVSVAAHSPLMSRAADEMAKVLATVSFSDPRAPLIANAGAVPLTTADDCRNELVEHLTRGVDWIDAVQQMADAGVERFVEIGPGKVLTGLIKRIAPDAETFAVDDPGAPGRIAVPAFLRSETAASAAATTGATS